MTQMKQMVIGMVVPADELEKIKKEIVKLVRSKKGEMGETQVSDARPTGAGATLRDM